MSLQALNTGAAAPAPGGPRGTAAASTTHGTPAGVLAEMRDLQGLLGEVGQGPSADGVLDAQGALQRFNVLSTFQATRNKVEADRCMGVIERYA